MHSKIKLLPNMVIDQPISLRITKSKQFWKELTSGIANPKRKQHDVTTLPYIGIYQPMT